MKHKIENKRDGVSRCGTLVKKMIIAAVLGIAAGLGMLQPAARAAGQVQSIISNGTAQTNVNFIIANTTVKYNLPGISTNDPTYAVGQSNAVLIVAKDARQVSITGSCNETATNTTTETFYLYCSNDGFNWFAPSRLGLAPDSFTATTLNTDYSTTNLTFGTNFDSGGVPLWAIGKITHSGAAGVLTNLQAKAFTKPGGI